MGSLHHIFHISFFFFFFLLSSSPSVPSLLLFPFPLFFLWMRLPWYLSWSILRIHDCKVFYFGCLYNKLYFNPISPVQLQTSLHTYRDDSVLDEHLLCFLFFFSFFFSPHEWQYTYKGIWHWHAKSVPIHTASSCDSVCWSFSSSSIWIYNVFSHFLAGWLALQPVPLANTRCTGQHSLCSLIQVASSEGPNFFWLFLGPLLLADLPWLLR